METIFKAMDNVMLIKHPISNRRIEYTRVTIRDSEDPNNSLRRIQSVASGTDMKNCPVGAHMLLKYTRLSQKLN